MSTPPGPTSGVIRLLHVPFDPLYNHVIDWSSQEEQTNYMLRQQIVLEKDGEPFTLHYTSCQYTRKDGTIKVPIHIDVLYRCNYIMYQNPYVNSKWFYCFVTAKRYINDNCTELKIETDVFSTWYNRIVYHASFVEREHIYEDTPGANTVPEGLETGPFIGEEIQDELNLLSPVICLAFTGDKIKDIKIDNFGGVYNGIPSTIPFLITDVLRLPSLINIINSEGNGDKIFAVFSLPKLAVHTFLDNNSLSNFFVQLPQVHKQALTYIAFIDKPEQIQGYIPRNKKLLTYPYCYLGFTHPNGSPKIYRYENFNDETIKFIGISEINPNPTVLIIPENYNKVEYNIPESATITGYPTISYRNDYYNTWLAQNGQAITIAMDRTNFNYDISQARNNLAKDREATNAIAGLVNSAVSGVASAITGNLAGVFNAAMGGFQNVLNTGYNLQDIGITELANAGNYQYDIKSINAQVEKQKMLPDSGTLSGSNATLLGYSLEKNTLFMGFHIKPEYVMKIDDYFDMFGYQTNLVKIPNVRGRRTWNYVKTVNINLTGNIPTEDLEKLKNIFNRGVTIWHIADEIYHYGADNSSI